MIAYQDGTAEFVPCGVEDSVVASAGEWHRGVILHARPKRCYFDVDYFECAINEGQEIRGGFMPDEGDDIEPFNWQLESDSGVAYSSFEEALFRR